MRGHEVFVALQQVAGLGQGGVGAVPPGPQGDIRRGHLLPTVQPDANTHGHSGGQYHSGQAARVADAGQVGVCPVLGRCGCGRPRVAQGCKHGLGRVKPFLRLKGAEPRNGGPQRGGAVVGRGKGCTVQPGVLGLVAVARRDGRRVRGQKRPPPVVDQRVEHEPQRIQIGAVVVLPGHDLPRGIFQRAGRRHAGLLGSALGDAEVAQIKIPGVGAQDVGRFDIPVQHAVLVADPQGVADIQRDLLGQGGGLLGGVVQVSGAQLVQRGQAIHADQNVQRRVIGFLDSGVAVDVDDVGAFQRDHPADLLQALFLDGTVVVGEGDAFLFGVGTVLGREIDPDDLDSLFLCHAGDGVRFGAGVHRAEGAAAEGGGGVEVGPCLRDEIVKSVCIHFFNVDV